jgi:hypothetical protein
MERGARVIKILCYVFMGAISKNQADYPFIIFSFKVCKI